MYRDFQARNVMVKDNEIYFIDFQGGRKGPIYYDIASFVWQASARYPEGLRDDLVNTYLTVLKGYIQVDEKYFYERLKMNEKLNVNNNENKKLKKKNKLLPLWIILGIIGIIGFLILLIWSASVLIKHPKC